VPLWWKNTLTPGGAYVGFNEPSPLRGPPEEKDAASLNVTSGRFAGATEAVCGEGAATKVGVSLSQATR